MILKRKHVLVMTVRNKETINTCTTLGVAHIYPYGKSYSYWEKRMPVMSGNQFTHSGNFIRHILILTRIQGKKHHV